MKTKNLTEFIRTDGIYQSSKKVSGEIHAACFLYDSTWTYLRFMTTDSIQIFTSNYDLSKLDKFRLNHNPIHKLADKYEFYQIKEENWCDGTFTFKRTDLEGEETIIYGNIRTDIFGEPELLIVDALTQADSFSFIDFSKNYKLEYEYLKFFTKGKYTSIGSLPTFGYSEIENAIVFQNFKNKLIIEQLGENRLDYDSFTRTEIGEQYFKYLKEKLNE